MPKKLYLWTGLSPLLLSLILITVIITTLKYLPSRMPLFYSLPWGENQLATSSQFLIIPASISIVTLLNLLICWQLHKSQAFFRIALFAASIIVSLILVIAFIKIVLMFI
ncbi:hypothetical protein HYU93_04135 [Candidatus Daviesbacteria bacterium]|nr:hypothetical protein [Candidatus Daviesbacteria bacterium]